MRMLYEKVKYLMKVRRMYGCGAGGLEWNLIWSYLFRWRGFAVYECTIAGGRLIGIWIKRCVYVRDT